MLTIKAFANDDDVVIVIKPTAPIPNCKGFAIIKEVSSKNKPAHLETLKTWVGFENDSSTDEFNDSTKWPIQRLIWIDYNANIGQTIKYKVIPMLGSLNQLTQDNANESDWSNTVTLGKRTDEPFRAFFNRGIVGSQWLTKRLEDNPTQTKLKAIIANPEDPIRKELAGNLGWRMIHLLDKAKEEQTEVFAALFELEDPALEESLAALGSKGHLILCNGTKEDANHEAREKLKHKINVFDRLLKKGHLGHNKFVVYAENNNGIIQPKSVWTGSTNWAMTGLCTQSNNGLLIENEEVAKIYYEEWKNLSAAKNAQDDTLKTKHIQLRKTIQIGNYKVTPNFTPVKDESDLAFARNYIKNAKQGILFLMLDPGTNGLLNDISDLKDSGLFIHGVVNADPRSRKANRITLFDRGNIKKSDPSILVPKGITKSSRFWSKELSQYNIVRVHSKVIVIDPFGEKPIVMTGSHNMSLKASEDNDDNLVVIENAPKLAEAYAVNILSVYNHLKWRFNLAEQEKTNDWKGLKDSDGWMKGHIEGPQMEEVNFWLGNR